METMTKIKRPKSCPSVRWRSNHEHSVTASGSSLLTTSSSIIISETKSIMFGNEVKISSHGRESCSSSCNYHDTCNRSHHHRRQSCRNNTLMFLSLFLWLMATFTNLPLVSTSSSSPSSPVNHVAVENILKLNRDVSNNQETRLDENGQKVVDVYSVRGQNVSIKCSDDSEEDESEPTFLKQSLDINTHWSRKNGGSLPSSTEKYQVTSKGNLFLQNVEEMDEDVYTCLKSINGRPGKQSQLKVIWAPKYKDTDKELPQILTKPTAQTIRLDCEVDAQPKATIKWLKDDKEIAIGGRITARKGGNLLIISQSVSSDSGSYSCIASNVVANVTFHVANLTVQASDDRPQRPKGLQVGTVTSTSVELTWKPAPVTNEALPIVSYSVHFTSDFGVVEDQKISLDNTIFVDKLTPSTNYSFYVRAYNKKGASEPSKVFRVQTKSVNEQDSTRDTSPEPTPLPTNRFIGASHNVPITSPVWIPVTITKLESESPTSVMVSWQKLPSAITSNPEIDDTVRTPNTSKLKITTFEVHYRKHSYTSNNYQYLTIEDTDSTSAMIEGLQPGIKYDIRVVATLSSVTASPAHSIPNERPPSESAALGHWIPYEMSSRDSFPSSPTFNNDHNLPPDSRESNKKHFNTSLKGEGIQTDSNNSSIIFTPHYPSSNNNHHSNSTITHVPDSPNITNNNFFFNNRNRTFPPNKSNGSSNGSNVNHSHYLDSEEEKEENLILGMVLDKLIVWSAIALVIFISLITSCVAICCCGKGLFGSSCSDRNSTEARTYANGHLPSMYGDTNGSEAREMQLFIDRDPEHLDTKGGSPESKPLTTKINGSLNGKTNIKTNGSLINSHSKKPQGTKPSSKSNGKPISKIKLSTDSEEWSRQGDDGNI